MSINKVNKETGEVTTIGGATIYSDAPIGTVIPFCGDAIPDGFLLADGQPISRTEYRELFNVIGTTYGTGDGSTTFNLPSMKGMFDFTNKQVGHGSDAILNFETTYQSGSGTQNFTVQKSGYYWVSCQLKQAEKKDYNFLQIQKSGITSRWYFRSFGAAGKYEIEEFIWFDKGDYVAKHEAYDSGTGIDGYGKMWIVPTTGVATNYIIKAKMVGSISDATKAAIANCIGYLGQESNYNLYPWSHERTVESADDNQNVTIERDGWYSIDYTLTSNVDAMHTFTLRDFDSLGEVHTIMRAHYDKSGTFRQTFLVPLKAGTYRYSHGGIGTLNVYMNRRDFA